MIKNMYTARSVSSGDIGIFTVTVHIHKQRDQLYFSLYRCAHPSTPNQDALITPEGVPQGGRIHGTAEELKIMVKLLFPILYSMNLEPSPY